MVYSQFLESYIGADSYYVITNLHTSNNSDKSYTLLLLWLNPYLLQVLHLLMHKMTQTVWEFDGQNG